MKHYTLTKDEHKTINLTKLGEYEIELVGVGAEVDIIGRFAVDFIPTSESGSQSTPVVIAHKEAIVKVRIIHKAAHTKARTSIKGVVGGNGKLKVDGRIIVAPNCSDINSFLEERVLLLSDQATAEVIPDLEIESDDVKCSHAATIGRIPEEQIFYTMSRGLTRQIAEELVVEGFLL